jgi:hypothetical protein
MSVYSDSTDRGAGEFLRFALGFLGFMVATAGVVVASPSSAFIGAVILLVVILSFLCAEGE